MWFKRLIRQSFYSKRWGILSLYLALAAILGIGWFVVSDRIAGWANDQIDEGMPRIMNWLFEFLSSDDFPIIAWLLLAVLAIIGFVILYRRADQPTARKEGSQSLGDGIQPKSYDKRDVIIGKEEPIEPLRLIDSFPKDNDAITTEEVKNIFLKFNKPIDRNTEGYIQNRFIRTHSRCQWNIGGWIQYSEDDTKLIWHVKEKSLQSKEEYGPTDIDYPTFEILIGLSTNEKWTVAATDGSRLPVTKIRVKIKPDALPSQLNDTQITVLSKCEPAPIENEPEISIEIDNCSIIGNPVIRNNQPVRIMEVALTLKANNPPINVIYLNLYVGNEIQKFVSASPAMSFRQENNKWCYIAKYEFNIDNIIRKVPSDEWNKYYLRVFANRQEWTSGEFSPKDFSRLLAPDKEDSQN